VGTKSSKLKVMTKYGKVVANKLWFKDDDGVVRYAFHNDTVSILDECMEYYKCYFPGFNRSFFVLKENIALVV